MTQNGKNKQGDEHLFTSEETKAELDTLGTLSTMACFMYLSMACSIVVCWKRQVNKKKKKINFAYIKRQGKGRHGDTEEGR